MEINEDQSDAKYQIKAYEPGKIRINSQDYQRSLIVSANELIADWPPQGLADLTEAHWQLVLALKPEIILLGTGRRFVMPKPELLAPVYQAKIGIEPMDTGAACRTYMALASEGRKVVAALLIG